MLRKREKAIFKYIVSLKEHLPETDWALETYV